MDLLFVFNSILLGIGLAMDAFSVSMANGLNDPGMKKQKELLIAFVFALFQTAMPLIGWACVHTVAEKFSLFERLVPWIALILLCYIGGTMIYEGTHQKEGKEEANRNTLGFFALAVQGIATSIDALSVGFTISEYKLPYAAAASLIIGSVTFIICFCGVRIGKKFGTKLAGKASLLGGLILIGIGLEIFITGIF